MSNNTAPLKEIMIYDLSDVIVDDYGLQVLEVDEYEDYIKKVPNFKAVKYLSEQSVIEMLAEKDEKIASLELKLREKYKQGYSDGVKDWENTYLNNNKK